MEAPLSSSHDHQVTYSKQEARRNQKILRDECINQFFDEVDTNKIVNFVHEESFQSIFSVIKKNALLIQKRLEPNGTDHIKFTIPTFPFDMFCAYVSQVHFNRKADVSFRY
jgi:hypothetical protein